jgi:hypothetical protein
MTDKKKSKKSKSGKDKKKQPKRRTFKGRSFTSNEFTGVQPYAGVARGMNYGGPYRGWVGGAGGGIIGERAPATKVVQDPKLVEQVADLKASLFIAQARAKFAGEHAATRTAQNLDNMQQNMANNRKEDAAARQERIEGMGGPVDDDALDDLGIDFANKTNVGPPGLQVGRNMATEASDTTVTTPPQPKPPEPQRGGNMDTESSKTEVTTPPLPGTQRGDMEVENRVVIHPHPDARVVKRSQEFKQSVIQEVDRRKQAEDARKAAKDEKLALKRATGKVEADANAKPTPAVETNTLYLTNGPTATKRKERVKLPDRPTEAEAMVAKKEEKRRENPDSARKERRQETLAARRSNPIQATNTIDPSVAHNLLEQKWTGVRRRQTPRQLDDLDNTGSSVSPASVNMSDRQKRQAEEYARTNPEAKVLKQGSMDISQGKVAQVLSWIMGEDSISEDDY